MCHICGNVGKLTYEHIPPKAVGNTKKVKIYNVLDMARNGRFEMKDVEGFYGEIKQQGAGLDTLCDACNSNTGSNYAEHFSSVLLGIHQKFQDFDDMQMGAISFEYNNLNVLAFFKQIITIFCSICPAGTMLDCKDFLLDRKNMQFDSMKYTVTMVAVPDKASNGWLGCLENYIVSERGNGHQCLAGYLCYPLGFLLYTNDNSGIAKHGADITSMSAFCYGETPHFGVKIPCVDTKHIIPEFFRDQTTISSN